MICDNSLVCIWCAFVQMLFLNYIIMIVLKIICDNSLVCVWCVYVFQRGGWVDQELSPVLNIIWNWTHTFIISISSLIILIVEKIPL